MSELPVGRKLAAHCERAVTVDSFSACWMPTRRAPSVNENPEIDAKTLPDGVRIFAAMTNIQREMCGKNMIFRPEIFCAIRACNRQTTSTRVSLCARVKIAAAAMAINNAVVGIFRFAFDGVLANSCAVESAFISAGASLGICKCKARNAVSMLAKSEKIIIGPNNA